MEKAKKVKEAVKLNPTVVILEAARALRLAGIEATIDAGYLKTTGLVETEHLLVTVRIARLENALDTQGAYFDGGLAVGRALHEERLMVEARGGTFELDIRMA